MRAMCVRYGFKMFSNLEDNMIRAELDLEASPDLSRQIMRNRIQAVESAA
jgi:hypothetical protein